MPPRDLQWPPDLHPATSPVFTHNELYIPADPEEIWAWLVHADEWETYYANCKRLRFLEGSGPTLEPGTRFAWRTFGIEVVTEVTEHEAPRRLAWAGRALGARGYHGWTIDPVADGCRVVTEETQVGRLPSLARPILRRMLRRTHRQWLAGLAERAREGRLPDGERLAAADD
jgi:hypothetical protein